MCCKVYSGVGSLGYVKGGQLQTIKGFSHIITDTRRRVIYLPDVCDSDLTRVTVSAPLFIGARWDICPAALCECETLPSPPPIWEDGCFTKIERGFGLLLHLLLSFTQGQGDWEDGLLDVP